MSADVKNHTVRIATGPGTETVARDRRSLELMAIIAYSLVPGTQALRGREVRLCPRLHSVEFA